MNGQVVGGQAVDEPTTQVEPAFCRMYLGFCGIDVTPGSEQVGEPAPRSTARPYPLGSLVICASCGWRMHGQTRGGTRRY